MRPALLVLVFLVVACGGNVDRDVGPLVDVDAPTRVELMNKTPEPPRQRILASGEFVAKEQYGGGRAALIEAGSTTLLLKGFQSTRGIDTRLYLSRDGTTVDALSLGPLQGYSGDYTYAIPAVDISTYRYVVVSDLASGQIYSVAELR
jgi:hypothetical protein